MLNLPEEYIQKQRLNKKIFIPKNEKPAVKKRVKDSVLKAELIGQIQGEDIPSVINETYNTSVIMFLNIETDDIKNANFLNGILQEMLKAFAIIKYYDVKGNIALGFGYKRLSKVEKNEIVLENNFITNVFTEHLFDGMYELLGEHIYFDKIKNKINKLAVYSEMMVKAYIISNKNLWPKWNLILDSNVWYNQLNTMKIYNLLNGIKDIKNKQEKVNNTADNIKFNKQLVELYGDMEELISE